MKTSVIVAFTVGVSIVMVAFFILASMLFFDAYTDYERHRPQVKEALVVNLKVASGNGSFQQAYIGLENQKTAAFNLPTNSNLQFTYIISCHAPRVAYNVTVYCDSVTGELGFLSSTNQTYPIPYSNYIGTMQTSSVKSFTGFIKTPTEPGIYRMQWHITSDQASYPFTIYLNTRR